MTYEKEVKLFEGMRMMGLKELPYWLSWFAYYLLIMTVTVFMLFVAGYIFSFPLFTSIPLLCISLIYFDWHRKRFWSHFHHALLVLDIYDLLCVLHSVIVLQQPNYLYPELKETELFSMTPDKLLLDSFCGLFSVLSSFPSTITCTATPMVPANQCNRWSRWFPLLHSQKESTTWITPDLMEESLGANEEILLTHLIGPLLKFGTGWFWIRSFTFSLPGTSATFSQESLVFPSLSTFSSQERIYLCILSST